MNIFDDKRLLNSIYHECNLNILCLNASNHKNKNDWLFIKKYLFDKVIKKYFKTKKLQSIYNLKVALHV